MQWLVSFRSISVNSDGVVTRANSSPTELKKLLISYKEEIDVVFSSLLQYESLYSKVLSVLEDSSSRIELAKALEIGMFRVRINEKQQFECFFPSTNSF